ncbi:hypothetical protein ACO2Q2_05105 [Dyella sp. KRB-257]|uniref:hypothetical protein n=1 Tax=Dyella sp. KRB-257 TaxID=3400915 RepID=UPI003C0B7DA3
MPALPVLTLHGGWIREFVDAPGPCFALGLIEEHGQSYACLALRPPEEIPPGVTETGFSFGHAVLGTASYEVIQFSFHFYGFATYHALVNPNNPIVQTVLANMTGSGDYFFLALGPAGGVTTFRSDIERDLLMGLTDNYDRLQGSTTTEIQYLSALAQFARDPEPPGLVLNWVCKSAIRYLDLTRDRVALKPAS